MDTLKGFFLARKGAKTQSVSGCFIVASRLDRMAKYNQLLCNEEELGDVAYFPGVKAFKIK